ncbi:uncharacterized protein C12orf50 homolog [Rissa tridactyla]|uniref:uncharacterized protein C12orf50 homolog n=1 Tax=Rissa tridactyla TaxID=75485 RepID=UPI0023BA8767|nr:uncharacterized protein C12orf50 homolog [Rissa tridactyla]
MASAGNDRDCHFYSPHAQQQYSNISCFWETQPSGCVRITCAFHHSKPRTINGHFLPPSNNAPLQQNVQEGILHPAHRQESLRSQEYTSRQIHPPLIISLNNKEDEEDSEEEENYVPNWVPRTAEDIEEEKAIKEIWFKSGEYYRIQYPHEHQSTKTVSSPQENVLLPLEATEQNLQKGIHTSDPKVKPGYQQRGQSEDDEIGSSIPYVTETGGKTYFHSSEPHRSAYVVYRTVTQEPKFSGSTGGFLLVRETARETYFHSSEPHRSAYVVYRAVTITQEPKFNRSTAVPEPYGRKSSKPKNQLDTNRRFWTQMEDYDKYTSGSYNAPTWRKRNPHAKTFSKFKTTTQQSQEDTDVNRKGEQYVERRKR